MPGGFDFSGRTAVVTGAASGIGAATAAMLRAAGAHVVGVDVRQPADRIVDVSDAAAMSALADSVSADGGLDVWVNVAGVIDTVEVMALTRERFDQVFEVNFWGAFYGAQAAARVMAARPDAGDGERGVIVNVVSAAIDEPVRGLASYAVSKAALTQLTRTLAVELGPMRIRVNAVAPGYVETAMTARRFTGPDGSVDAERREERLQAVRRQSPLREVGRPEDIAAGICYLASDAARFVTGEVLRINGGTVMR